MARRRRDPVIEQAIVLARRLRAVDSGARCADCGTDRHLRAVGDLVLCYGCRSVRRGISPVEADHLAGRAGWGSLTVRLRANDHRTVSELRKVLGFDDLPEPGGDPLLVLAQLLAGIATLFALLVGYLVAWALDLQQRHGPRYWVGLTSPVVP